MKRKIILKRILTFLKPYRFNMAAVLLLSVISVGLALYLPILIGQAVDLIGDISAPGTAGALWRLLWKMAIAAACSALAAWIGNLINNGIIYRIIRDLRCQSFNKMQRLPLGYLDKHSHGDILSRIITDIDQLGDGLLIGFTQIFTGMITILVTFIFMLSVNPVITAVVVFLTPISLLAANIIAKKSFKLFKLQSEARGEQAAFVNEIIGNQVVVKVFGREEAVSVRFGDLNESLARNSLRAIFCSSIVPPGTRFINNAVYAVVALAGALYALGGGLSVGQITVFLAYATQYTKPFNEISEVIAELQNALACGGRVFDYLAAEEEDAVRGLRAGGFLSPDFNPGDLGDRIEGAGVLLKEVSFSYYPQQSLIENFNLAVKPGQRVAIVGPTGCGKTTIINLLMRFYDVDSGRILVGDKDIREIERQELRKIYGMVLQDTWLRYGTIRDNIVLGKPDAADSEIVAVAKATHAHSFIRRLPDGYDTVIGEDGGSLSQGEKQLLCITRVMLLLPPMLILDEATSSIDTRTEQHIQQSFARLMEGRTSFIVAHRLSTIRNADVILVMKEGRIVEQGRHEELLAAKGFYFSLYNSQSV